MAWTQEDWLIIDTVLNQIAKALRRIEREERLKAQHQEAEQQPPQPETGA